MKVKKLIATIMAIATMASVATVSAGARGTHRWNYTNRQCQNIGLFMNIYSTDSGRRGYLWGDSTTWYYGANTRLIASRTSIHSYPTNLALVDQIKTTTNRSVSTEVKFHDDRYLALYVWHKCVAYRGAIRQSGEDRSCSYMDTYDYR